MSNLVLSSNDINNLKKFTNNCNSLIKKIQKQSSSKLQLPPILSQRKSSLDSYKNAPYNFQSNNSKSKSVTQKILDLSKKKKAPAFNSMQTVNHHQRYPSQILYTLTDQQKQLLASKQLKKSQGMQNSKNTALHSNASYIMKQIQDFHQEQKKKEREKETLKKQRKIRIPLKILDQQTTKRKQQIQVNEARTEQFQIKDMMFQSRNRRLSFELSQNERSLRFHRQSFDQQIPSLLIKSRKVKQQKLNTYKYKRLSVGSIKMLESSKSKKQIQCTIESSKIKKQEQSYINLKNKRLKRMMKKKDLNTISYEPWNINKQYEIDSKFQHDQFNIQNYSTLEQAKGQSS